MGKQGAHTPLSLHGNDKERTMIARWQTMNARCASDDCLMANYDCPLGKFNAVENDYITLTTVDLTQARLPHRKRGSQCQVGATYKMTKNKKMHKFQFAY